MTALARAPLASCIYEGRVQHRRLTPIEHRFSYRLFLMYLDLDELPGLFDGHPLWSARGPALAWFRRSDHFGDPALPLAAAVRDLVEERTGERPAGPIRLLTHLRYFGFVFNPVSFFFCFEAGDAGDRLRTIVAEVDNTPWGERHLYVLDRAAGEGEAGLRFRFAKQFHVSPFIGMDVTHDWAFTEPGPRLSVVTRNHEHGQLAFDASLSLARRPLSAKELRRVLIRHPMMTARVLAAIYWQALRLKLKGAPFHPHPRHRVGRAAGAPLETPK